VPDAGIWKSYQFQTGLSVKNMGMKAQHKQIYADYRRDYELCRMRVSGNHISSRLV